MRGDSCFPRGVKFVTDGVSNDSIDGRRGMGKHSVLKRKNLGQGKGEKSGGNGMTVLKKRIRSIRRMLDKGIADEHSRTRKLEEIENMEKEIEELKNKREFLSKFKTLVFVERRKVIRKVEKHQKNIERLSKHGITPESDQINSEKIQLEKALLDLDYIRYFPVSRKYVPLFPKQDSEELKQQRVEIREIVTERKRIAEEKKIAELDSQNKSSTTRRDVDENDAEERDLVEDSEGETFTDSSQNEVNQEDEFFL